MLRTFSRYNRHAFCRRRFAAAATSPAYDNLVKRFDGLKKDLPGLFDPTKMQKEQQALIDAHFKAANLKTKTEAWNKKVNELKDLGVRFQYEIGGDTHMEGLPENQPKLPKELPKPSPLVNAEHDWKLLKKKFETGAQLVDKLAFLKDYVNVPWDKKDGPNTLKLIAADDVMYDIDTWYVKLELQEDEFRGCALPVSDNEVAEWCEETRERAPFIGDNDWGSSKSVFVDYDKMDQKKVPELKKWFKERDDRFFNEVVLKRDKTIDRAKWDAYNQVQNELFDSHDLGHYQWSDEAKDLFRAALWQGKERVFKVEEDMKRLVKFMEDAVEDETDIKRKAYEDRPELPFRAEAALELEARDPLVVSKMLMEIKDRMDKSCFEKGVKELLAQHLKLFMQADRAGLTRALKHAEDDEPAEKARLASDLGQYLPDTHKGTLADEYRRLLKELDSEEKKFDAEPETLEALVDELVPKALWMVPGDSREADINKFKSMVIDHCKGKGKLADLNAAFWKLMPNHASPEWHSQQLNPKHHKNLMYFCQYYASREAYPQYWDIKGVLSVEDWELIDKCWAAEGTALQTKYVNRCLDREGGFDPIIYNMFKVLIEARRTRLVGAMQEHYSEIVKLFKGELHGVVYSAEQLTDKEFTTIKDSLGKANPTKKFFLSNEVDSSLLGGFKVKIGVQTIDFSLSAEVDQFKRAGGGL